MYSVLIRVNMVIEIIRKLSIISTNLFNWLVYCLHANREAKLIFFLISEVISFFPWSSLYRPDENLMKLFAS